MGKLKKLPPHNIELMESRPDAFKYRLTRHLLTQSQGFTLIELLVVIVIVGILSAVAVPTFINQIRRARTAEAQTSLYDVGRASEAFRLDHGSYPYPNTWQINPHARANLTEVYECTTHLECLEGGTPSDPTYLRLYLNELFQEKAPNYSDPAGTTNTHITATLSPDSFSGILWGATANTDIARAYKNASGDPLECRLGLGTGLLISINDGGPNIDSGCNIKIMDPLPLVADV
jgi:prepilin-type N-terminal cleavage/methylation domain-containing protein